MKLSTTDYNRMKNAINAVVNHFGGPDAVATTGKTPMARLWRLFHLACRNLQYDDSHPAYAQGHWTRTTPYDPTFQRYPSGINDSHWETALRKIGKELNIT